MKTNTLLNFLILYFFLLSIVSPLSHSLSTNSRWIVAPSGERFKLSCVNWAGHLHAMIPEGLEKQPLKAIAQMVPSLGFNCVRLTWAIKMYTKYANLTVEKAFEPWNLTDAKNGIAKNNLGLLSMSVSDVQKVVIDELGLYNVVVILDNHVSEPIWCCGNDDGNGFFGDKFFDTNEWLQGLSIVANRYKENPTVVGMSLRNELRGPKQNEQQWYNYMQQGAETINKQNPRLLVIVSGLSYDTNLQFLKQKPFKVTFKNKLVFESHWYPFSNSLEMWKYQTNELCGKVTNSFLGQSGFLLTESGSFPLFLSEFGIDLRGGDEMENLYLSCVLANVAGSNMDWALWAFQGSYMLRQNVFNMEEVYGVLSIDWGGVRSTDMMRRLLLVQQILLDPSRNDTGYYIMYHPQTGLCIQVDDDNNIYNSDCRSWAKWSYNDEDRQIKSIDGQSCLTAIGDGLPVTLSDDCTGNQTSLSTNKRYIVTPSGDRFKLRCVNWPGHIHAMIPEGLCKQPLKSIAEKVHGMGFNCVRLTWAVHMYSLEESKNKTVEQSLDGWNLNDAKDGFKTNNPDLLNMTLADAQKAVVDELGANNVMVILDNHVSFPIWCCNKYDGNGFFGDVYFDPEEWLTALGTVANRYKGNPTVIGMSMRNELRGPRQDVDTWYKYMQQGAEIIHKNSPEFLVIVSGFNFDTHLEFLKQKAFNVSFKNKLVFESHLYSFDDSLDSWKYNSNAFCGNTTRNFFNQSGFLLTGDANNNSYPLFFSEFGVNLKEENEKEDYYLSCLLAFMAENDLDWALWALQGSYMIREGKLDLEEYYGMLSKDWGGIRNSTILQKFQIVQQINIEPNSKNPTYTKLFHPKTGLCVHVDNDYYVYAGECVTSTKFSYKGDGNAIKLSDGKKCMVAVADGLPVVISDDCYNNRATWNMISGSRLHIASKDEKGNSLCLEWDYPKSGALLTKKCLCVDENDKDLPRCEDNPMSQWFSFVPSNVKN